MPETKKNNNSAWDAQTFPWALVFVRDLGPLLWCTSWLLGQAQSSCWESNQKKKQQETIKSGAGPNFTPRSLFYFPPEKFPKTNEPKKRSQFGFVTFQSHPSISGGWLLLELHRGDCHLGVCHHHRGPKSKKSLVQMIFLWKMGLIFRFQALMFKDVRV